VTKLKQPFAIRILTWFAALASAGMYLSILLAVLDIGPHIMGGECVTRNEWLHIAAPLVAVIGILMAFIAYGFATQKHWSRHLVIAMFSLIIVYATIFGALNLIHYAIISFLTSFYGNGGTKFAKKLNGDCSPHRIICPPVSA
jgi:hypothetical protein